MPIATPQGTLDFKSVDKVTFVGASSNTVIDTTTGSLGVGVGVGGPTSNLHVVGDALITGNVSDLNVVSNVNMLHTSNTASIKLNSNVVAEFPRSKKLIKYPRVALTSASRNAYENGYKVTFSSEYDSSTWAAEHVFDNSLEDGGGAWASATGRYGNVGQSYSPGASIGGFDGEYVHLELPVSINLSLVRMLPRTYQIPCPQAPKDYIIIASTDGVTYDLLRRITNEPDTGTFNEILINTPKLYNRFAVVIEKTIGSDLVGITEIEFLGTPEYDPEAHGTDVTVKSVANVPNTDWLEVYYDAKGLSNGAVTDPISGLGGTTINGTATNVTVSDGAFVFDGSSSYINGGTTPISGNHHHSFSCWLKPTSGNTNYRGIGYIIHTINVNNATTGLFLRNMKPVMVTWGSNLEPDYTLPEDEWVHVTAVYYGTGRKIYVNSKPIGSDTYSSYNINASANLYIGASTGDSGASVAEIYNGSIANFRLFNRALTSDEIYQLYAYQKEYFGLGDLSMTLKAGRLGIGTSEPLAMLDVRGAVNITPYGYLQLNQGNRPGASSATHGMRWTNTDNVNHWHLFNSNNDHFRFVYNGAAKGWVDPNDPNNQMNFTGQHRTFIKDVPFSQVGELEGLIVSSDQNKYIKMSGGIEVGSNAITTNESLPVVSLSNVVTDKKCFGVISASEDPENRTEQYGAFGTNFEKEKGDTRVYINSVGEGAIWVSNIGGNLEAGDYITTSNVAGYGQKQEGAGLMNYTVAKITMDCDFEPVTQPVQIIKKDETGENVLDEHDQIQWEDHPTETEKVYKIRYLGAGGVETDEANAVHIAAFVGCTYHCG